MALYRKVRVDNAQGAQDWWLVYPAGLLDALRLAWIMWRCPGKVPALMRVPGAWVAENCDEVTPNT